MHLRTQPAPLAVTRLRNRGLALFVAAALAAVVYYQFVRPLAPWASHDAILLVIIVSLAAIQAGSFVAEWRLRRSVELAESRICPDCVYPLEGDAGVCPECGRAFTIEELVEVWRQR